MVQLWVMGFEFWGLGLGVRGYVTILGVGFRGSGFGVMFQFGGMGFGVGGYGNSIGYSGFGVMVSR